MPSVERRKTGAQIASSRAARGEDQFRSTVLKAEYGRTVVKRKAPKASLAFGALFSDCRLSTASAGGLRFPVVDGRLGEFCGPGRIQQECSPPHGIFAGTRGSMATGNEKAPGG